MTASVKSSFTDPAQAATSRRRGTGQTPPRLRAAAVVRSSLYSGTADRQRDARQVGDVRGGVAGRARRQHALQAVFEGGTLSEMGRLVEAFEVYASALDRMGELRARCRCA